MDQHTHYFVAVSIPEKEKILLKNECEQLKSQLSFKRWVHPLDYHITLAFLGSASQEQLTLTKQLINNAIKDVQTFSLFIQKLGVFGKSDSPRVFWANVQKNEQLYQLRDKVFSACKGAGFSLETRPFTPHITLSRQWTGEKQFTIDLLKGAHLEQNSIPFEVTEVVIYETHINKSPKYYRHTTFPLKIE